MAETTGLPVTGQTLLRTPQTLLGRDDFRSRQDHPGLQNLLSAKGSLPKALCRRTLDHVVFTSAAASLILLISLSSVRVQGQSIPEIGPVGEVQRLHTGFAFTEGPAADAEGNLYFTDIPNNRIHRRSARGELTVFVEPSGHCNGLMVHQGQLLACAMDGRLTAYSLSDANETVLASEYDGKRFNAPNDLVIDRTGGIYFTDPRYRAPDPWPQGKEGAYYRAADGTVTRLLDDRIAPNGIILSPDESRLYVIPSMEATMYVFDLHEPGKPINGRPFCELKQAEGRENGGGDGVTIDTAGNLYITTALGIQVFAPSGKALGIIPVPEHPANCTFGGKDYRTLYVTARKSLYAIPMQARGHVFPGPDQFVTEQ